MSTNLNVAPYYDDFDETKGFQQIVFKPGYAVQARELTQLQSILRDQIKKFGDHVFQHGSIVIPGNSYSDLTVPYVKINPTFLSNTIDYSIFENKIVIGVTNGVKAIVKKALPATATDPITFYLAYISGGGESSVNVFQPSEEIYIKDNVSVRATLVSGTATGIGSMAVINKGVYYVSGSFALVLGQSIVISKYDSVPSCHVLLKINELIVNSDEDSTLLDPAQGSYNYAAPGADRIKLSLELVTKPIDFVVDNDYIEIMRFRDGILEEHSRNPKYSELEKSLARRTFDESGNYVVNGLDVRVKEHLKTDYNNGVYVDGDKDKLVIDVSPGTAYISGFEINKLSNTKIVIDKARTSEHIKESTISVRPLYGNFLYVTDVAGLFNISVHETVDLWNTSDNTDITTATKIGTASIFSIDYFAGDPATNAIYKFGISDIQMLGEHEITEVGGIRSGTKLAKVLTEVYAPVNAGAYTSNEIVNHTSGRTGKVNYWNPLTSKMYLEKLSYSFNLPKAGDLIIGATSSTSSTVIERNTLNRDGQNSLVFSIPFSPIYSYKDTLHNDYTNVEYTVQKELTIVTNSDGDGSVSLGSSETIDPIEVGTFVALASSGVLANTLFSINGIGSLLTITGGPINSSVKVYAAVTKSGISPKTKTVSSNSETITSPSSRSVLAKCDIIEIISVIDSVGDITPHYTFDSGQSDYSYNKGTLILLPGKSNPVGNITVTYSYYEHSISGDFFCRDSYPSDILDKTNVFSSNSGVTYNLSSCIDFRPAVGASNSLSGAGSRINDKIITGTLFESAVQYYLPRLDILTIDSAGICKVVRGMPNAYPTEPAIDINLLKLSAFFIPAYTTENSVLNIRMDVSRYTMQDIHALENRVKNLENYTTLTSSENSVLNLEITDAATGLTRFKTGYLVETFENPFSVARTTHRDYSSTFVNGFLFPGIENLDCSLSLVDHSNIKSLDAHISLPFTEKVFAAQRLSSRITNINPFLVIAWEGLLSVMPSSDTWVETFDKPMAFDTEEQVYYTTVVQPCPPPPPPPPPPLPPPPDPYYDYYVPVQEPYSPPPPKTYWTAALDFDKNYNMTQATVAVYNDAGKIIDTKVLSWDEYNSNLDRYVGDASSVRDATNIKFDNLVVSHNPAYDTKSTNVAKDSAGVTYRTDVPKAK